jgi:ubiquinol-cytochrome c reductase cytochrome b subunit
MWSFGSTAGICLVIQIITGIFLAMHYTPHIDYAFLSVEHIMTDVKNGWLIRYIHANGASMFFIVVYCHIFRGLYYGSYMYPRGRLWASGVIIFLLMMATAFMGYVLPWGQMSFWGATVITNLFSAIPFVGHSIVEWLWGGFSVGNATLNRFYSLHYFTPFAIAGLVILHLSLLHKDGSNNPLGINTNVDNIPFYPYFYVKDLFAFFILAFVFSFFVFFYPNVLGHSDNYIPANPLSTPAHIVPEWYFLPFYAILRSIPDKLGGVVAMISAILVLLLLPIINTSNIRSSKFRPIFALAYWFLVSDFIILGWIGQKPVESPYIEIGMFATFFYFFFLLILVPAIGIIENKLVKNNDGITSLNPNDDLESIYFGYIPEDYEEIHDLELLNQYPRLFFIKDSDDIYQKEYFNKYSNIIIFI